MLILVSGGVAYLIQHWLLLLPLGMIPLAILGSTLLAQRSLHAHVERVALALEDEGIESARARVSEIVGRDTASLDEAGVSRAAIESLAENFSDGVVAPALWMVIGGLPGAAIYKAINTADSMIGHHSERYEQFGWASARLDDLVNLPASRLSALLIMAAAYLDAGSVGLERVRRGAARCRRAIAHPMPAIRKRLLPARSDSPLPARAITAASWSRMCGWEMGATRPTPTIFAPRSRSTGAPTWS